MSKLVVNCGGMFSGKSTELQRQGKRHLIAGRSVVFLKPLLDTRYSDDAIVTHEGRQVKAINIVDSILIPEVLKSDIILIDEIQFFSTRVIKEIDQLVRIGKEVHCSGLDMDYRGREFYITAALMSRADVVNKFNAVCECCGDDAVFTGRKQNEVSSTVLLGEKEIYTPLCRPCYYRSRSNGLIK